MVDVIAPVGRAQPSYISWSAVAGGAIVGSALSFVLLTAGASIGLSTVSAHSTHSHATLGASVAVFWMVVSTILSYLIAGYIAGRIRETIPGESAHETEFRDGLHGALVWALSIVIGGILAAIAVTSASNSAVGAASISAEKYGLVSPAVDKMLRNQAVVQVQSNRSENAPTTTPRSADLPDPAAMAATRDEISRILNAAVIKGQLVGDDRQYTSAIVAQRLGIPVSVSEKRVDEAYAEAVQLVETARKSAVLAGLVAATGLLIGLAAAWYAAQKGGSHKNDNRPAKMGWSSPLSKRL